MSRLDRLPLAVWFAMTAAGFGFVLGFGHDAPWNDEWEFVPALFNEEPVLPWLWKQHNEHRLPLPRLLYYGLFQLTGDFRAGSLLQIAILSALSLGLMRVVSTTRGRADWADSFVPIGLLNWGHVENFLMGYQINFVLVCSFACGLTVLAWRANAANRFRIGVSAGVLALLVELCGGTGLVIALPIAGWVAVLAIRERSAILALLATLILAYLPLYFHGYTRPDHHPPLAFDRPLTAAWIAGQVLAMSWGYGIAPIWLLGTAATLALVAAVADHEPRPPGSGPSQHGDAARDLVDRLGLLAVLAGGFGVAVAIGFGRAGFGDPNMGLWSRYGLFSWPLLFAGFLFVSRSKRGLAVQRAACLAAVVLLPMNLGAGWKWAANFDRWMTAWTADARDGVPAEQIAKLHPGQEDRVVRGLPMLRSRFMSAP